MLKTSTSIVALAALIAAPAFAQDDNSGTDEDYKLDVVTVTGFQLQNRNSIDAKANEDRIADFLSQDELGRQPDLNVADSLRRLPGVVTIFDEDEGRYVGLRGLDQRYTFISIDGGLIASTDRSDRDINIESIPPTAVKRLEVFKAITPDLDAQSVGGVINLVTRSAFDSDDTYLVMNAQLGWHESIGDLPQSKDNPSYRVDAAWSDQFANNTIGVLAAGTVFQKKRDQGRTIVGVTSNDTGLIANSVQPLDYANQIDRWNGLVKLEYRPNTDFEASITASRFDYQYDEVRYRFDITESDLVNQTADSGTFQSGSGRARFDRFPLGQTIDNVQALIEYRPTERSLLEVGAYYSHGVQGHPYPNASFTIAETDALGYSYDFSNQDLDGDKQATITLNDPSILSDLDAYQFTNYFDGYFRNEEDVTEFKLDYSWNTEGVDAGLGFKTGLKYRNLEKNRYDSSTNYVLSDPNAVLTLSDFVNPSMAGYTSGQFKGFAYPLIDADAFDAYFNANRDQFTGTDASGLTSFYDIQEDVTALYGMLTYKQNRHSFLGGFRFEHTEVATVATLNSGPEQIARTIDYDYLLPSFVYTYDLNERMKLRAGYAQAIGRPNHPDLAGAETFDETNRTIRRANTGLRPRESESFDLAFDWFLDGGQYFSAAAFYKIIDNQISTVTTEEDIDGVLYTVTQPVNLDQVSVSGLELSYTDDAFEFLPAPFNGLGVAANLTLMDGKDGPAPGGSLIAQPDYLYNIAGLYNYGPFSAKLTYNYVDDRPTSATQAEYQYEQLDLQLRYQLTERLQMQVEGRNIQNNPRKNIYTDSGVLREINDFGNSWWFGVSYRY